MVFERDDVSLVALEVVGIVSLIGGMVPLARPDVSMWWTVLVPIGLTAIVLAIRTLGSMNATSSPDTSHRRVLFRFGLGCALGGILSSWLALAVYRPVIAQVGGVFAGACLLFTAIVTFGACCSRSSRTAQ